jgi:hypothetical protein
MTMKDPDISVLDYNKRDFYDEKKEFVVQFEPDNLDPELIHIDGNYNKYWRFFLGCVSN